MSKSDSDDYCSPGKDYFKFNLICLTLVGLWRNDDWPKKWLFFYDIYENIIHILPIIYIIITCIGTYQHHSELTIFLSNLDKNMVTINFITKYIFFILKRKKIVMLITEIQHSGDKITKHCVKLMTVHVILITSSVMSTLTAFSGTALLSREMAVETWMPFDPTKNLNLFLLTYQILLLTFTPCILRGSAMQGIVCSLIMYVCEQLKELQRRIQGLKFSLENEEQMLSQFREIITKHVRLIRYSGIMKEIFMEYFFIQNIATTFELCLSAVMITVAGFNELKLLVSFLAFLCVALLNAFIYCYLGNELIIQSENIAQAAYDAEWTSWPVRLQKSLLTVITNAQKPLAVSAGGIVNMSMQTFAQALYNGYSIFAVLADAVG